MKILITGGAGFIGSHLADSLLLENHEILVIDNLSTGNIENLSLNSNLEFVEGSISNENLMNELFSRFKPNIVVHAAASYKDPEAWIEDSETNIKGTINVINNCKINKVQKLIYFNTALCYGLNPKEQPITIDHPLNPEGSSYAFSKTTAEMYLQLSGLNFVSFRLANAYGPRNISGPLPTFYNRLTTNKKCFVMDTRRDFIFIQDLVDVVLKSINGVGNSNYYHISSGSDFSIKELFEATIKVLNIKLSEPVEVRERGIDDAYTILLDPSQTEADFDWKANYPLMDGVTETINWYNNNSIKKTYTHLKASN